jgi:hypothetical protein
MPRWEVLLRANTAIGAARAWLAEDPQVRSTLPPAYASGDGPVRFALADGEPATLFTPQPLTRWSPFGRSESCHIVVRHGAPAQVVRTSAERDALLAAPVVAP